MKRILTFSLLMALCLSLGAQNDIVRLLAENPDLESVTIPESVKEVQTWAFGCCSKLKNMWIFPDMI